MANAKFILTDGYVEIDGHDVSDWAFQLDTPSSKDQIDVSGFNPSGTKETLVGQRSDSCTVSFVQDFTNLHPILNYLYVNNVTFVLNIRPTSGSVSATNPQFTGNAKIASYNALSGSLNNRAEIQVELVAADSAGLVWSAT